MQGKLDGKSCPVLPCPIGCFRRIGQCIGRRKSQVLEKIFRSIKQIKVPDFLRNQELFGGDYWTRTSDLLRVKKCGNFGAGNCNGLTACAAVVSCAVNC